MKIILTASTLAVALVGTVTAQCDPNDWADDAATNHFTADCSGVVNTDDPCPVTMATGYWNDGGGVTCDGDEYTNDVYAVLCSEEITGAVTCTYDSDSGNVEPTSCAPVKETGCYPSCERKVVSEWDGPINDNGGTYGCAPLCNASDAEFGWVNDETTNHFFADCSNAVKTYHALLLLLLLVLTLILLQFYQTKYEDKCVITASDGYFWEGGGDDVYCTDGKFDVVLMCVVLIRLFCFCCDGSYSQRRTAFFLSRGR
jgi:hypothetical protein